MKLLPTVLTVTAAFGGTLAFAAKPPSVTPGREKAAVVTTVNASVVDVCTFKGDGDDASISNKYGKKDADGRVIKDDPVSLSPYTANSTSGNQKYTLYVIRCTSNTTFAPETSGKIILTQVLKLSDGISVTSKNKDDDANEARKSGVGSKRDTLNVEWSLDTAGSLVNKLGTGDVHVGNIIFKIPAGQWNSSAGLYVGTFKMTINYQ